MKNSEFKDFLFRSAIITMACDGHISDKELNEIKNIVDNEIYFMGFEYENKLRENIEGIKANGKNFITEHLQTISKINLNENQELLLIEVLLKIIQADEKVEASELRFLQLIRSKLKVDEHTIIVKFPHHLTYLMSYQGLEFQEEFLNDIAIIFPEEH